MSDCRILHDSFRLEIFILRYWYAYFPLCISELGKKHQEIGQKFCFAFPIGERCSEYTLILPKCLSISTSARLDFSATPLSFHSTAKRRMTVQSQLYPPREASRFYMWNGFTDDTLVCHPAAGSTVHRVRLLKIENLLFTVNGSKIKKKKRNITKL